RAFRGKASALCRSCRRKIGSEDEDAHVAQTPFQAKAGRPARVAARGASKPPGVALRAPRAGLETSRTRAGCAIGRRLAGLDRAPRIRLGLRGSALPRATRRQTGRAARG